MASTVLHRIVPVAAIICALQALAEPYADRRFAGEHIMTMNPEHPNAEVVAILDGGIIHVGNRAQAQNLIRETTVLTGLGNRALVPGLVDSHGHVNTASRLIDCITVSSPSAGTPENIDDSLEPLKQQLASQRPEPGQSPMAWTIRPADKRVQRPVVWGPGKANAAQAFADEHGIDLRRCYLQAVFKPISVTHWTLDHLPGHI